MALSNGSSPGFAGFSSTVRMHNHERIQFDLDSSYPTGGYTSFGDFVKTILGTEISIVDIQQTTPCGGYKLWWDRANDTLMVYQYPNALGASTEVPNGTDLSAVTDAELVVTYI